MSTPAFGLGTFRLKDQAAYDSVSQALDVGYRLIDTAQIYGNEAEVGRALADSGVPRRDVFLTTKIWIDSFSRDKLVPSLKESLKKLRTEQVDLTLIHWPSPKDQVPMQEYLEALADAKAQGLTRAIGVSNFTIAQLDQAIGILGAKEIATNQIEVHPFLQNHKLTAHARARGIHVTSYMTLAYGKVIDDLIINEVAKRHGATPAQVALAWALQQGYAVIPSSTKRANLEGNLKAQSITLDDEDMKKIATLDRGERLANPEGIAPAWD